MLNREDKAGLYITMIVHLVILIILLKSQIGFSLKREKAFVIDFAREEELRRMEEKMAFSLSQGLEERKLDLSSLTQKEP